MRLDDMMWFAAVVEARSFTAAARRLQTTKQTVSRRIAELEARLGVQLLHRTTRRLHPTDVGAAYAERCAQIVRLADEANRAVTEAAHTPTGVLRITADPTFGEAFMGDLVVEFAGRWPAVEVEVVLTRRHVDLVEEGFDVAFRVGAPPDDPALTAIALGPAEVRLCASPAYLERRGRPRQPEDLADHDLVDIGRELRRSRWPFLDADGGLRLLTVAPRLRVDSPALAHAAVAAGLGIGLYPAFAAAPHLTTGVLEAVLDAHLAPVGAVYLVHPTRTGLSARVRAFVALAVARLAASAASLDNASALE